MVDEHAGQSTITEMGGVASERRGKNIVICLDGTGNQFGRDLSNVVKIFRMLERIPGKQVAYYDPGVGTMGDPTYKTWTARKINKVLGLAFGRGLTKNLIEAYTFLMENYEVGDRVFLFGFSRGAYTARALAAFIRKCGLLEKGTENLIPYAMKLFLSKAPKDEPKDKAFKVLSGFRSTLARRFDVEDDPKYPGKKRTPSQKPYHYQLRIHFMGLFDTVKSYGWVRNPVVLHDESKNPSILHLRHALAIDEQRIFFRQMHWISSPNQDCKEVWFPGVHSDVGGGYPEAESGLAKVDLEWMVHEACALGMQVDPYRYGRVLGKVQDAEGKWVDGENPKYPAPSAAGQAHDSLKKAWRVIQLLPKSLEPWELSKSQRTIKSELGRSGAQEGKNPLLVHQSVLDRMQTDKTYFPENLIETLPNGDIEKLSPENIEQTLPVQELFDSDLGSFIVWPEARVREDPSPSRVPSPRD